MSVMTSITRSQETDPQKAGTLHIVPALVAPDDGSGGMIITRKFLEGIAAYQQRWPGAVRVHMLSEGQRDRHLDDVVVQPNDPDSPFRRIKTADASLIDAVKDDAAVFLVSLIDRHLDLVHALAGRGVPVALITEQSERTRHEIIRAESGNPVLRWRRQWWSHRIERQYVQAVEAATGVQCNGAPTYETYRHINNNCLFYLDSRMTASMMASSDEIERRIAAGRDGGTIRLAFTGRLTAIKGADDLPIVARHLRDNGVAFTMDIIGGGEEEFEQQMRSRIDALNLRDKARMPGVMDFESQLVPHLRENIDLFVCCHRQGDPSCTYIETLGCGVPIAGYDNEAWRGMHELGAPGWVSRMADPEALAETIIALSKNRDRLDAAARRAREFALDHTFEATMDRRAQHLLQCAGARGKAGG